MKALLFQLLFLLTLSLEASEVYLRDGLKQAEKGDYLVTFSNKLYTALLVRDREGSRIILDEISIPEGTAKQVVTSWREWLEKGAPYSTSSLRHTIEATTGKLLSLYSFANNCYLNSEGVGNLFSQLVALPFTPIPEKQQRHIAAKDGSSLLWQPKLYVNGVEVQGVRFGAYHSLWPKDGTDLQGMEIVIYLPEDKSLYSLPFPTWLKVKGKVVKVLVRAVDSGKLSTTSHQPN